MAQYHIRILNMIYNNQLKYIALPWNAKYEECIEVVIETFNIPSRLKKFIKISHECGQIFENHTFDCYSLLFPNPETIFSVEIDGEEKFINEEATEVAALANLNNKRKNCDDSDEEDYDEESQNKTWDGIVSYLSGESASKECKPSDSETDDNWWHMLLD